MNIVVVLRADHAHSLTPSMVFKTGLGTKHTDDGEKQDSATKNIMEFLTNTTNKQETEVILSQQNYVKLQSHSCCIPHLNI